MACFIQFKSNSLCTRVALGGIYTCALGRGQVNSVTDVLIILCTQSSMQMYSNGHEN